MTESIEGTDGDLITMTVAPGRTIQTGNEFKTVKRQQHSAGGMIDVFDSVPNPGKHIFAEGESVTLPRVDAMRQHALGFLLSEGESGSRPLTIRPDQDPVTVGLVHSEMR